MPNKCHADHLLIMHNCLESAEFQALKGGMIFVSAIAFHGIVLKDSNACKGCVCLATSTFALYQRGTKDTCP